MIQFYSPDIETTGRLDESDSAHCVRVLRKKEGDEIVVVDGKGSRFICIITEAHPKHTQLEIQSKESVVREWDSDIILAVAPTKHSDRMEWMLEKVTEIGLDKVVLVKCARSERKEMKVSRLEKVMVSAMKQSLKATLPEIGEIVSFKEFIKSIPTDCQKFFGYCDDSIERIDFAAIYDPKCPVVIMIGPEGDFSPEEVEMAIANGFVPVTFGNTRLRTETAALYGVTAAHVVASFKQ